MYSSTLPSTPALDGGGWSTPRPGRFSPRERPGTHCIGGWLGSRSCLDGCGKSRPHRDLIPGPSSPQRVAIPTELSRPVLLRHSFTKFETHGLGKFLERKLYTIRNKRYYLRANLIGKGTVCNTRRNVGTAPLLHKGRLICQSLQPGFTYP